MKLEYVRTSPLITFSASSPAFNNFSDCHPDGLSNGLRQESGRISSKDIEEFQYGMESHVLG
jgi:hypothetical protein